MTEARDVNAELKQFGRQRPPAEVVEWDKHDGEFVRQGVERQDAWTPERKIALDSDVSRVIDPLGGFPADTSDDVKAAVVAAVDRLDTLEALAVDVDDTDEFFAMLDGDDNG